MAGPQNREKFESRGRRGVITGYGPHRPVEILDLEKFIEEQKTVFIVTRDFQAMEDEFPVADLRLDGENPKVWRLHPEEPQEPVAEFYRDANNIAHCRFCSKIISDVPITCPVCVAIRDTGKGCHKDKLRSVPITCARSRCQGHEEEENLRPKYGFGAPNEQSVDLESEDDEATRIPSGRCRLRQKQRPEIPAVILRRQVAAIERRLAGIESQAKDLGIDLFENDGSRNQEELICVPISQGNNVAMDDAANMEVDQGIGTDGEVNAGPGPDHGAPMFDPSFASLPQLGKAVAGGNSSTNVGSRRNDSVFCILLLGPLGPRRSLL